MVGRFGSGPGLQPQRDSRDVTRDVTIASWVRENDPGHQNDHKIRGFEFLTFSQDLWTLRFDILLVCTVRQQSVPDRSVIGVLIVILVILIKDAKSGRWSYKYRAGDCA